MTETGGRMARLAWVTLYLGAAVNISFLSWQGRNGWHLLPLMAGLAFLTGVFVGRCRTPVGTWLILLPIYLAPTLFLIVLGLFYWPMHAVWLAALLGLVSSTGFRWSLPRPFATPLALWGLCVALGGGVVLAREADFSVATIVGRSLVTSATPPTIVTSWIALLTAGILIGVLWFNWLFGRYTGRPHPRFVVEIVVPLAAGWLIATALGLYQFYVDLTYFNRGFWANLGRAGGTFDDANPFGAICAIWGPIAAGVFLRSRRPYLGAIGALACLFLGWLGVWASGSRGALVIIVIASATVLVTAAWKLPRLPWRLSVLAVGLLVLVAVLWTFSASGPLQRLSALGHYTRQSPRLAIAVLWESYGYAGAAVSMIREHPWSGIGLASFYHLVPEYSPAALGYRLPPDNAQNWYRHQIAELGLLGSVGWIGWILMFLCALARGRVTGNRPDVSVIRWVLIAFGLVSLVGMPGQNLAVAFTIWTMAFWFLSGAELPRPRVSARAWTSIWALVWIIAIAHLAATAGVARGDLRLPYRAARFNHEFTYGFQRDAEGRLFTAKHAVTVPQATAPWLKLTYWVEHPDADANRVQVDIWRDRERIVNRRLSRDVPVTEYVAVPGEGKRFVLEVKVDRTFRPSDYGGEGSDEQGLVMKWEFVERRPGS